MNSGQFEFWMVYGEGQRAPAFKHDSFDSAVRESERLAREHPGVTFYTLKAIRASRRTDVQTVELTSVEEDMPF